MKSIVTSVSPYLCEKIASGDCKILVKKSAPKETPFKAYIYAIRPKRFYKCGAVSTSDELLWLANGKIKMGDGFKFWADGDEYQCLNGRIIGEFVCDKVYSLSFSRAFEDYDFTEIYKDNDSNNYFSLKKICLTQNEIYEYAKGRTLYGWHISDLKIYDKPKELSEFRKPFIDYVSPKESKMVNPKIGISEYVTCPPQSWIYVEELK